MVIRCALAAVTCVAVALVAGCESDYKATGGDAQPMVRVEQDADMSIQRFRDVDPSLSRFFDTAYAYAIYPNVKKGGLGVGGAYGEGVVYQGGQVVGYSELRQGTIGAQIGGQTYSQLIFFQDEAAFNRFKFGNLEFSAQATAVAAREGAARNADWDNGVAVFTVGQKGLMAEASVGGQTFSFRPVDRDMEIDARYRDVDVRTERRMDTGRSY